MSEEKLKNVLDEIRKRRISSLSTATVSSDQGNLRFCTVGSLLSLPTRFSVNHQFFFASSIQNSILNFDGYELSYDIPVGMIEYSRKGHGSLYLKDPSGEIPVILSHSLLCDISFVENNLVAVYSWRLVPYVSYNDLDTCPIVGKYVEETKAFAEDDRWNCISHSLSTNAKKKYYLEIDGMMHINENIDLIIPLISENHMPSSINSTNISLSGTVTSISPLFPNQDQRYFMIELVGCHIRGLVHNKQSNSMSSDKKSINRVNIDENTVVHIVFLEELLQLKWQHFIQIGFNYEVCDISYEIPNNQEMNQVAQAISAVPFHEILFTSSSTRIKMHKDESGDSPSKVTKRDTHDNNQKSSYREYMNLEYVEITGRVSEGVIELDKNPRLKLYLTHTPLHAHGMGLRIGSRVNLYNITPVYFKGRFEGFAFSFRSHIQIIDFSSETLPFVLFSPDRYRLLDIYKKYDVPNIFWILDVLSKFSLKNHETKENESKLLDICLLLLHKHNINSSSSEDGSKFERFLLFEHVGLMLTSSKKYVRGSSLSPNKIIKLPFSNSLRFDNNELYRSTPSTLPTYVTLSELLLRCQKLCLDHLREYPESKDAMLGFNRYESPSNYLLFTLSSYDLSRKWFNQDRNIQKIYLLGNLETCSATGCLLFKDTDNNAIEILSTIDAFDENDIDIISSKEKTSSPFPLTLFEIDNFYIVVQILGNCNSLSERNHWNPEYSLDMLKNGNKIRVGSFPFGNNGEGIVQVSLSFDKSKAKRHIISRRREDTTSRCSCTIQIERIQPVGFLWRDGVQGLQYKSTIFGKNGTSISINNSSHQTTATMELSYQSQQNISSTKYNGYPSRYSLLYPGVECTLSNAVIGQSSQGLVINPLADTIISNIQCNQQSKHVKSIAQIYQDYGNKANGFEGWASLKGIVQQIRLVESDAYKMPLKGKYQLARSKSGIVFPSLIENCSLCIRLVDEETPLFIEVFLSLDEYIVNAGILPGSLVELHNCELSCKPVQTKFRVYCKSTVSTFIICKRLGILNGFYSDVSVLGNIYFPSRGHEVNSSAIVCKISPTGVFKEGYLNQFPTKCLRDINDDSCASVMVSLVSIQWIFVEWKCMICGSTLDLSGLGIDEEDDMLIETLKCPKRYCKADRKMCLCKVSFVGNDRTGSCFLTVNDSSLAWTVLGLNQHAIKRVCKAAKECGRIEYKEWGNGFDGFLNTCAEWDKDSPYEILRSEVLAARKATSNPFRAYVRKQKKIIPSKEEEEVVIGYESRSIAPSVKSEKMKKKKQELQNLSRFDVIHIEVVDYQEEINRFLVENV